MSSSSHIREQLSGIDGLNLYPSANGPYQQQQQSTAAAGYQHSVVGDTAESIHGYSYQPWQQIGDMQHQQPYYNTINHNGNSNTFNNNSLGNAAYRSSSTSHHHLNNDTPMQQQQQRTHPAHGGGGGYSTSSVPRQHHQQQQFAPPPPPNNNNGRSSSANAFGGYGTTPVPTYTPAHSGTGGGYGGGATSSRPISPLRGDSMGGGGDYNVTIHQQYGMRRMSPTRSGSMPYYHQQQASQQQPYYDGALAPPSSAALVPSSSAPSQYTHVRDPISMNNVSDAFHSHRRLGTYEPSRFAVAETRLHDIANDVGATAALHNAMAEMERSKNAEIRALLEENAALREHAERETEAREVAVKALCAEAATASYLTHAARKRDMQAALWHWQRRLYKRQCQRMSEVIVQTYDAVSSTMAKSSVVVDVGNKSVSKAIRDLAIAEQQLVMRRVAFYANVEAVMPEGSVLVGGSDSDSDNDAAAEGTIAMSPIGPTSRRRGTAMTEEEVLGQIMTSPVRPPPMTTADGRRRASFASSHAGEEGMDGDAEAESAAAKKSTTAIVGTKRRAVAGGSSSSSSSPAMARLHTITRQYKDLAAAYAGDVDVVAQRRMGVVAAYLESIADQLNLASALRNHLRPFDAVGKKVLGLRSKLQQQAARARAEAALAQQQQDGSGLAPSVIGASATAGGLPCPPPANPLDYTPSLVAYGAALDVYKDAYHSTISVTALPPLLNLLRAGVARMSGEDNGDGGASGDHSQSAGNGFVGFDDVYTNAKTAAKSAGGADTNHLSAAAGAAPRYSPTVVGPATVGYEDAMLSSYSSPSNNNGAAYALPTAVKAIANYFYDGLEQVMLQSPMTATANVVLQHYLDAHVRLPSSSSNTVTVGSGTAAAGSGGSAYAEGGEDGEDGGTDNRHAILTAGRHSGPIELDRCKLYINPLVKTTRTFTEEMAYFRREGIASAAEARKWAELGDDPCDNGSLRADLQLLGGGGKAVLSAADGRSSSVRNVANALADPNAANQHLLSSASSVVATRSSSVGGGGAGGITTQQHRVVVVGQPADGAAAPAPIASRRQSYDQDALAAQLADSLLMKDAKAPLRHKWDGMGGFTASPLSHIAHIVGRRSPVRPQPSALASSSTFGRSMSAPRAGVSSSSVYGGDQQQQYQQPPHHDHSGSGGGYGNPHQQQQQQQLYGGHRAASAEVPSRPSLYGMGVPPLAPYQQQQQQQNRGEETPLTKALRQPQQQQQYPPSHPLPPQQQQALAMNESPIRSTVNPQQQLQFTPVSTNNQQQQQQRGPAAVVGGGGLPLGPLPPAAPVPSLQPQLMHQSQQQDPSRSRPSPSRGQQYHQHQLSLSAGVAEAEPPAPIGARGGPEAAAPVVVAPTPAATTAAAVPTNAASAAAAPITAAPPRSASGSGGPLRQRSVDMESVSSVSGGDYGTRDTTPQREASLPSTAVPPPS